MKQNITIGYFPVIDHIILGVASHNDGGSFENFNLNTKLFHNWDKMSEELKEGKIDGTFILFPLAMNLFREGLDIKLVLLGQREGEIVTLKKGIQGIADLKGKTIFIPHKYSMPNILMHQLLKREGIDPEKDVKYKIGFQDIRELESAIKDGVTDAIISAEPWGILASKNNSNKVISISHDIMMHHVCCVLVLRNKLIVENPEVCEELIRSLVKAGMFVSAYPRQTAEICEDFLECPRKILLESLTHDRGHLLTWDLLPRLEDFSDLQDIAIKEMNLWSSPIDLSRFIEPKFAQEAYREWMIDTRQEVKDKGGERTLPGNFTESFTKIKDKLKDEIKIVGIKFIKSGEKFPKGLIRQREVSLRDALNGKNYIWIGENTGKGIALFKSTTDINPDRAILELTKSGGEHCINALNFGTNLSYMRECVSEEDFVLTDEISVLHRENKTLLNLSYTQCRFLGLLLEYF